MERQQYLIHYNTSNNSIPSAENMKYGEIAVRYSAGNEAIFIKNTNDEIITLDFNKSIDLLSVVSELPTGGDISNNKIYLVPSENTGSSNTYIEYIYANGEWEKLGEISVKTDLSEYYTKEEVDSNLEGYVKSEELSNYVTTEIFRQTVQNLESLISENKIEIDNLKEEMDTIDVTISTALTELREELTETINLKADKNEIPSLSGYATEEYVENSLSNYALRTEIPSVDGFLTSIPEEYITETELEGKGYLTEHQDISNLATKDEVNAKADSIHAHDDLYYTESEINSMLSGKSDVNHTHSQYLTEHQDISGKQDVISDLENIRNGAEKGVTAVQPNDLNAYALKTEIPSVDGFLTSIPDEYITETELDGKNYATKNDLSTLDAKLISSLNNINSQLSNYAQSSDLENKQNKTITVSLKNTVNVVNFDRIVTLGSSTEGVYDLDDETTEITNNNNEFNICYIIGDEYMSFCVVEITEVSSSGPEKFKVYTNANVNFGFEPEPYDLSQYKYEGDASKNYYCEEDEKYYKWNEQRKLEETTYAETIQKTISVEEAINEIYQKLGL